MEQDEKKGLLCGLLAAGIRMEGLLRVVIERPETEKEVEPQIREAFELYRRIFKSVWPDEQTCEPAVAPESAHEVELETVAQVEALLPDADKTEDTDMSTANEVEREPTIVADVAEVAVPEVLKLDELIARRESADLRRAFTLNDKFRFRRTLFGGSNERFSDVLDHLESMTDGREAQKYLSAIIDVESEDGADFMNIVNAHFGIRQ